MIAHGVKHGRSSEGTARWFASIGFRQPTLARTSAGFFIPAEGYEYVLNLATAAVAVSELGPGRISVARALPVAAGFGLLGAAAQPATFRRRPA